MTGPKAIEAITELDALRARVAAWKRDGLRVGFVPTMGNLHAGHHSLVRLARTHSDKVVASIFVNPTQFGPNEDFSRYPRTPEADIAGLRDAGCDLAWMPSVDTMYPFGLEGVVQVRVPGVTGVLEGAHRPGHFDGVATVVARLFHQVQPDAAVFGRKDYQQLAVIRYMVRELAFPLDIVAGETLREADGLAMSSRNQYLSAEERALAPRLHRALLGLRDAVLAGVPRAQAESQAAAGLAALGFDVDYILVRRADLSEPVTPLPDEPPTGAGGDDDGARVALVAARLGRTRLIDNLEFSQR
jgi:pantoate--beta-alanine ligase